jgi:hypothetical protein
MLQKEYTSAEVDACIELVKTLDIPEEKKTRQIELYEAMRPENKKMNLATEEEVNSVYGEIPNAKTKTDEEKMIDQIFGPL